jgi:hypothetical protein
MKVNAMQIACCKYELVVGNCCVYPIFNSVLGHVYRIFYLMIRRYMCHMWGMCTCSLSHSNAGAYNFLFFYLVTLHCGLNWKPLIVCWIVISWVVTPWNLVGSFRGTCCLHHQGRRTFCQMKEQVPPNSCFPATELHVVTFKKTLMSLR